MSDWSYRKMVRTSNEFMAKVLADQAKEREENDCQEQNDNRD